MPSKLRAMHGVGASPTLALFAALLLVTLALTAVLATGGRGPALAAALRRAADTRLASLGFRVAAVHLQGASPAARGEILAAARPPLGAPILTVALAPIRARVERDGWVASARVMRLLPDTLVIAVKQRPVMAVWQHAGRADVVAGNGAVLSGLAPAAFPGLPLIVGPSANVAAPALLPLIAARPLLSRRLAAAVRVDGRRWDLRLASGPTILLPAENVSDALRKLDTLERNSHALTLGLARIDLRVPEMIVVRPSGAAAPPKPAGV